MLPLKDKTVLVTRSEDQVADFIGQLQNLGAKTISLPLIETTPINQEALIEKFNTIPYDWIIFTSATAVRFFFDTISPQEVKSKIAAVGEKTGQLVRKMGLEVSFIPSEYTGKHLANEIPVEQDDQILIPRSEIAKNDMVEILKERKCKVDLIPIYDNHAITHSKEELAAIFSQKIDFITFTSGSTVKSFIQNEIPLRNEKIICIGPETANLAQKLGIKVDAIASSHTIDGMIQVMTGQ